MTESMFTYHTRVRTTADQDHALGAYAELHGHVERRLFVVLRAGADMRATKREFIRRFGISGRQLNSIRIELDGKITIIRERRPELIKEAQAHITKAEKEIRKLERKGSVTAFKLHHKKRRLATMRSRLAELQADEEAGDVRLCFGSRKLFHAQFNLEANGYADHEAWKRDWQDQRSNQFFVCGSKNETAGNGECQAVCTGAGFNLQLKLPKGAADAYGTGFLEFKDVRFAYGHEQIQRALASSVLTTRTSRTGRTNHTRTGTALSYRFLRDAKGWRIFVTVSVPAPETTTSVQAGAIGIDVNADHLAYTELDRFGNIIRTEKLRCGTYGKSTNQAKAVIGDVASCLAAQAKYVGKPVVLEKLNCEKHKAELEGESAARCRQLSSFAYNAVLSGIKSACFRAGVEVREVNPAYTSTIGAVNYAQRRGISVHMGAAAAIARRGMGLSERPATRQALVPARDGGHVTFPLPVRNRGKHVWAQWSEVRKRLKTAHVAHLRSGLPRGKPAPLARVRPPPLCSSALPW